MVKRMDNPIKMDDLGGGGSPYFRKHPNAPLVHWKNCPKLQDENHMELGTSKLKDYVIFQVEKFYISHKHSILV